VKKHIVTGYGLASAKDSAMARTRHRATLVLCALAILVTSQPANATQRYKWWASEEVRQELQLTNQQTDQIESIFRSLRPKLKELAQVLQHEAEQLADVMHTMQAEEWEVTLQIDKVESARSALSKTRTLMLYRVHKKLSAEQLERLQDYWEHHRSSGDARSQRRR